MHQILSLTNNFDFLEKICPKRVFPVYKRKDEHHHRISFIRVSLASKFQNKQTILNFWTKFAQKWYFRWKREKVIITIEFSIIRLDWVSKFSLNKPFCFLDEICPKWELLKQKSEQHHRIKHIQISLYTKFHLKQTILVLWTIFAQKG